jgi:hypothetical protein
MGNARFIGIAIAAMVFTFVAVQWLAAPRLKRDPRLPTFHRVAAGELPESSHAGDNDAARNGLRNAVLDAAESLRDDPCNELVKARYIREATKYARAWLSMAPCMSTMTCSNADSARLDRAQQAFGTPLDRRVREAMAKAHETDALSEGDFPRDALVMVAGMAGDPVINPNAAPDIKAGARDFRTPSGCRAAALR